MSELPGATRGAYAMTEHPATTVEFVQAIAGADAARSWAALLASREGLARTGPLAEIRGCGRVNDNRRIGNGISVCTLPLGHEPADVHRMIRLPLAFEPGGLE
jgi:hypothetical protein